MKIQITFFKIIFIVRLFDTNSNFIVDFVFVNSMIKARDVYNIKTQMRREKLESMTSMQTLMHELDTNDWTYFFRKNRFNQMSHFFFSKESSQIILKINYEILIMNCIYKTNKYKMFLMIIFNQIKLHKIFYAAFCFMFKEKQNDYVWIMKQLKTLYEKLKFSDFTIIVIDMKWNKISTFNISLIISSNISLNILLNILYRWHEIKT